MISHILNIIKGWFRPEEQVDPHEALYLHSKKPDVPVYKDENAVKKEHCDGHLRFRKSCPTCQEIVK